MKTLRFPLVGSITNRNTVPGFSAVKDQQFVNCFPEVVSHPITKQAVAYVYKRQGFTAASAYAGVATASGGMVVWTGSSSSAMPIVAGFRNTGATSTSVWNVTDNAKIGANIDNTDAVMAMTETMVNTSPHLVGNFRDSSSLGTEQWYFPEGGAWAQVTSACLTSGTLSTTIVGFPAHMDGFTFNMMRDGRIRNSDLNTVSSYPDANFIFANDYPDKGVTVARIGNYIAGFGEKSIQFFHNAGNAGGSILARVQGATLHMGAARKSANLLTTQTVLPAFGTIYWLGTNSDGAITGIYRFNGVKPEKISTPAIDKLVTSRSITGFAGTLILHGQSHVVLRGTGNPTLEQWCYCVDTNVWWRLELTSAASDVVACIGATIDVATASAINVFLSGINSRANIMDPGNPVYQDATSTYTMTVQTANMDEGTNRKKVYHRLDMAYDRQASTSPVTISASDNDFVSYTTLGTIDTVSSNPQSWITRLGASRRRSWKFEHSANTPFRAEAVEIKYTESDT